MSALIMSLNLALRLRASSCFRVAKLTDIEITCVEFLASEELRVIKPVANMVAEVILIGTWSGCAVLIT